MEIAIANLDFEKAALEIFEQAGLEVVFEKNRQLNNYLWFLLNDVSNRVPAGTFTVFTPVKPEERGCQLSLQVKNGRQVFEQLAQAGVFADWREPDVIRVAPVALYNRFMDVWQFAQHFQAALHKFAL